MNNNSGNQGLDVYLWDHLAGHLRLDEKRRFVFQYDAEWIKKKNAIPLSLHLPLRADIYPDDLSRPFFFQSFTGGGSKTNHRPASANFSEQ
jgi:serine/threonine-protein kinase HipA